jgi:hypothetical protein
MSRAAVVALALVTLVAVGAGCGGGGGADGDRLSREEYQQRVTELGDDLDRTFGDFGDVDPQDIEGSIGVLGTLAEALDTAGDRFDELDPPEEVQNAQDTLVDGAHTAADSIRQLADDLEGAGISELPGLLRELDPQRIEGFDEIQKAVAEFEQNGYDLSGSG